ncbi:ParA family protein [Phyllobacterium myrsinacearum]|uniref:Chromosome partitioning protein n=1 Tax=Phyllobacterium myrsinacearum TaxID=28101 RepID=A0A839EU38_9HYPH|nr:ParA family protein [Phyllobacterium myrsinacearum]MBA8881698.1 chromosome partitioning protein [Phyllobacterium myrsinacearum]
MVENVISCLSQKGGVGKSTFARLIARTYASAGWSVKIADFNVNQLTSTKWAARRMALGATPEIAAEVCTTIRSIRRDNYDLIVADGTPDSDQSSLEIARIATLNVIPTGLTLDDLEPQILFANELVERGVDKETILFVLNKTTDSKLAVQEARQYLSSIYRVAETDLGHKTGYQMAQNVGLTIAETNFPTLNERADQLAAEIVSRVNEIEEKYNG